MTAKVYHINKDKYLDSLKGVGFTPVWPQDFYQVADVDTDKLDEAFKLTNHIDHHWWDNEGVRTVTDEKVIRSTSIGDVIEVNGIPYRVAPQGWTRIGGKHEQS